MELQIAAGVIIVMVGVQNMGERPTLFRQRRQYRINNRGVYDRRHARCRLMRQLAHEATSGVTAVVDPAVVDPVLAALAEKGWTLTHILNTHHHNDHTGGNLELQICIWSSSALLARPNRAAQTIQSDH